MKISRYLWAALALLCFHHSDAQSFLENYPIAQFKLPDIDRQTLEWSGNLLGDLNIRHNQDLDKSYTTTYFHPDFSIFRNRYINREDLQSFWGITLSPNLYFDGTKNEFEDERLFSSSIIPSLSFSGTSRKYKGVHFGYKGLSSRLTYLQDWQKTVNSGITSKSRSRAFTGNIDFTIGFGHGRIEYVSDVMTALFLLQDATDLGLDSLNFNSEKITAFAAKMAVLRNERIFDSRIKWIRQLRELYSFMQQEGWTIPDDPGFFTVLTDNWIFGSFLNRYAGSRWTYTVTPSYDFSFNKSTNSGNTSNSQRHTIGAQAEVRFEKFKPLNLHRDHWRTHAVFCGIDDTFFKNEFDSPDEQLLKAGIENTFGLQWIPSSRSWITANLDLDYTFRHGLGENPAFGDQHTINTALDITANYYLSYKTRFFGNFTTSYDYYSDGRLLLYQFQPIELVEYQTGFHTRINAGITMAIY